jgi:hypothetical protein
VVQSVGAHTPADGHERQMSQPPQQALSLLFDILCPAAPDPASTVTRPDTWSTHQGRGAAGTAPGWHICTAVTGLVKQACRVQGSPGRCGGNLDLDAGAMQRGSMVKGPPAAVQDVPRPGPDLHACTCGAMQIWSDHTINDSTGRPACMQACRCWCSYRVYPTGPWRHGAGEAGMQAGMPDCRCKHTS